MKILVGLGNPGRKYLYNRHNVGFMVIDRLAKENKLIFRRSFTLKGYLARRCNGKTEFILVKPTTFMNNSGDCVRRVCRHFRVYPEDILIIYDDVSLEKGKLRLKPKGSSGGHKGMQSIIESLGTEKIPRLRIGIGQPDKDDLTDYVLGDFSETEKPIIEKTIIKAVQYCHEWLNNDIESVMAKCNR